MDQLEQTIQMVQQMNPSLAIGGILVTMIDRRTTVNALVEQTARDRYGDLVFQTTIPMNVKMIEAPAAGQAIGRYATDSAGARAYRALAEEVRQRWPVTI
jgi:chromosome partitioning protein